MTQAGMAEPYGAADGLVRVYPADTAPGPSSASQGTALVWAHGGGFRGGDLDMPEAHWTSGALAARGITVVSVDYRHAGDGFRYPLPSDDILTAWAWTLDHADELGIDLGRLAIGGASAGANLVTGAVLRMLADDARALSLPAGIFLAYPTLLAEQPVPSAELAALLAAHPSAAHDSSYVPDMYENYFGGPVDDAPLAVVPGLAAASDLVGFPPVLMINSEIDHLRVSGEVFATTLVNADIPLELATEPGAMHGHLNRPDEPAASDSIERVVGWFTRGFVPETSGNQTTPSITEGIPS